ncbi:uncharacterized protein H6S33_004165 [Morchella sextelata]|uniref:uncharacterized protein n=1 Tax=Morchella sextelata TaxID=1174677 RepID=UPI001D044C7F|nr:uncharacterized protein H6S33_004165 [Morchella sextelata]KAH0605708.1 hypothetical protein H6S33_004165 [Morchella sextelata]
MICINDSRHHSIIRSKIDLRICRLRENRNPCQEMFYNGAPLSSGFLPIELTFVTPATTLNYVSSKQIRSKLIVRIKIRLCQQQTSPSVYTLLNEIINFISLF